MFAIGLKNREARGKIRDLSVRWNQRFSSSVLHLRTSHGESQVLRGPVPFAFSMIAISEVWWWHSASTDFWSSQVRRYAYGMGLPEVNVWFNWTFSSGNMDGSFTRTFVKGVLVHSGVSYFSGGVLGASLLVCGEEGNRTQWHLIYWYSLINAFHCDLGRQTKNSRDLYPLYWIFIC